MINIKSSKQIETMRAGGQILKKILNQVRAQIKPGITKLDLESQIGRLLDEYKIKATFLGYRGYPALSCISINEEIVHGIPRKILINEGDLVSVDLGLRYQGLCLDAAFTVVAGKTNKEKQELLRVTQQALKTAIETVRGGVYLGDVQVEIQKTIEGAGLTVIRGLAGHGIGEKSQEEPFILNFGKKNTGPILKAGMTLAFEPMVSLGKGQIKILDDNWTIITADKSLSAHFEDTVVVGEKDSESLTGQYKIEL